MRLFELFSNIVKQKINWSILQAVIEDTKKLKGKVESEEDEAIGKDLELDKSSEESDGDDSDSSAYSDLEDEDDEDSEVEDDSDDDSSDSENEANEPQSL